MQPLITFIIPVYNGEKTISRAVNSIIKQPSFSKDVEVLVIENGSTDKTVDIICEIGENNDNVIIFHSEKGVSNARNLGLKKSRGQYIVFLDADDFIPAGALEYYLSDARISDSDLYLYNYEKGKRVVTQFNQNNQFYLLNEIEQFRIKMISEPTNYMCVWAKMFKKEIISEQNIYFNTKLKLAEDSDFVLRFSYFCQRVFTNNSAAYHYSTDNPSTIRGNVNSKVLDYYQALLVSEEWISRESLQIQKAFNKYKLMNLNVIMVREIFARSKGMKYDFYRSFCKQKEIIKLPLFRNAIDKSSLTDLNQLGMLPILLFKYHLNILSAFIYNIRSYLNFRKENSGEK